MTKLASYIVVNGPHSPRVDQNLPYRGTYRSCPKHADFLPEDHEFNRLFEWYLEEGGESGVVHNVGKALRLAQLSNRYLAGTKFEVIQITEVNSIAMTEGEFLGFDITLGYSLSLLYWGFQVGKNADQADAAVILWSVISNLFSPKLNRNGLFQDLSTAEYCHSAMNGLQSFRPNFFEGEDLTKYRVVGLSLITGAPGTAWIEGSPEAITNPGNS